MGISHIIRNIIRPIYGPIMRIIRERRKEACIKREVLLFKDFIEHDKSRKPRVFYLGIAAHSNLGDMAQYYCIHNWINVNYENYNLIEIEADTVVETRFGFIDLLKRHFKPQDIIIFQSGYTTQDLGGVHDLMHREIIKALPDARILMMPQTIFFKNPDNERRSSMIYNSASNMLFLARDKVSYDKAKEMMPDIRVKLYPDIVTSLIGKYDFSHKRHGICLCRRNDGEKFYTDLELDNLTDRLNELTDVKVGDTTLNVPSKKLRNERESYILKQIEEYSRYEVVITDRYHGTIFSLAAGTPVVIIKTNDHKVVTGADWFKGIYDDYIYVANDLDDAYQISCSILSKELSHKLLPIFYSKYYKI